VPEWVTALQSPYLKWPFLFHYLIQNPKNLSIYFFLLRNSVQFDFSLIGLPLGLPLNHSFFHKNEISYKKVGYVRWKGRISQFTLKVLP
jgi:hypothetical protein